MPDSTACHHESNRRLSDRIAGADEHVVAAAGLRVAGAQGLAIGTMPARVVVVSR